MNCRKRTRQRIAEQDRNAVGSLHRQQNFRRAADERVALLIVAEHAGLWFCFLGPVNHAHVRAVNLPTTGQRPDACEELEKAAPIFVNIFRFVFIEAGQVQRVTRERTDAAQPG